MARRSRRTARSLFAALGIGGCPSACFVPIEATIAELEGAKSAVVTAWAESTGFAVALDLTGGDRLSLELFSGPDASVLVVAYDIPLASLGLRPGALPIRGPCPLPSGDRMYRATAGGLVPTKELFSGTPLELVRLPTSIGSCCPLDPACAGCGRYRVETFSVDSLSAPRVLAPLGPDQAYVVFGDAAVAVDANGPGSTDKSLDGAGLGFVHERSIVFPIAESLYRVELDQLALDLAQGRPAEKWAITTTYAASLPELGSSVGPLEGPLEAFTVGEDSDQQGFSDFVVRHFAADGAWHVVGTVQHTREEFRPFYEGHERMLAIPEDRAVSSIPRLTPEGSVDVPLNWPGNQSSGYVLDVARIEGIGLVAFGGLTDAASILRWNATSDAFEPWFTRSPDRRSKSGRLRGTADRVWLLLDGGFRELLPAEQRICPFIETRPLDIIEQALELENGPLILASRTFNETPCAVSVATRLRDDEYMDPEESSD